MYREDQLRTLLAGKTILIAGYGREGRSAERLIQRLVPDAQYTIASQVENGKWKTESGEWRTEWPFDMVIKSPGIPNFQFPTFNFQLTSLTDLFLQVYGDLTIGVTGTKGKSTTASLIHHLLPGSILAGNIGIPLFDILDDLREDSIVVAELSCHQLENIHFFYCTDNDELRELVKSYELSVKSEKHPYSINDISSVERQLLDACPLEGEHNRSNALVASRVASLVTRQPLKTYSLKLKTFQGLHHRMEKVGTYCGITWYDDSISTIPAAAIAAVKALGRVDTLILGGFDRGIDYSPLVDFLQQNPIKNVVFVGAAGRRIHSQFSILNSQFLIEDDYTKIVPWCAAHTPQGGVVLLSPAAASYDAFKNFEHRGDFYREQILKLTPNS